MDKSTLEAQGIVMSEEQLARIAAIAAPANQKARETADSRLRFDDEPGHYLGFLRAGA